MKKIIYLYGLVLVMITSCNYLDIMPTGQVIPEKTTEFRAMLTDAYNTVPQYKWLLGVRSDEALPCYIPVDNYFRWYIDIASWNTVPTQTEAISSPWSSFYKVIFNCNHIIKDGLNAKSDGKESKEQIVAEAYLLRAYMHFELVNMYGTPYNEATAASDKGIPISTIIDIEQKYTRATVKEVYAQIISDIEQAELYMQEATQPIATRYRFSKEATHAFKARVALYMNRWDTALTETDKVLKISDKLENLNDVDAKSPLNFQSDEAILSLNRLNYQTIYDIEDIEVAESLINLYDKNEDLRFSKFFKYFVKSEFDFNTFQEIIYAEYYISNKGLKNDERCTFRRAEIYLIAAEANAQMGQTGTAAGYLKKLLETRLKPSLYSAVATEIDALDQEGLIERIAIERQKELALEGHRWFDLRRTTQPRIEKIFRNGNKAILNKKDPRYTISIPKEAIDSNPGLLE